MLNVFFRISLVIGLIICSLLNIHAQQFQWVKSFGGASNDVPKSITTDVLGNVYTTGSFISTVDFDPGLGVSNLTSNGQNDVFVQKLDVLGNLIWVKSFGGSSVDQGLSVLVDSLGNVYTTGRFSGTVDFDPGPGVSNLTSNGHEDRFIHKMDVQGNFVWVKTFWGISGGFSSFSIDKSGNTYTAGFFDGAVDFDPGPGVSILVSNGSSDAFVQKLDASGNFLWAKSFGATSSSSGPFFSNTVGIDSPVFIDALDNVYTTGRFFGTIDFDPGPGVNNLTWSSGKSNYIQKLDASGNFLWAKSFGGYSVTVDPSGNVYITGTFRDTIDFDPGPGISNLIANGTSDVYIQKLDASGNFLWAKSFGGSFNEYEIANSITVDALGNVYTTGIFNDTVDFDPGSGVYNLTSKGRGDVFVQKLDSLGNFNWATSFGGISNESGDVLSVDLSGNVYTTGNFNGTGDFDPGLGTTTLSSNGSVDVFVQKLSQSNFNVGIRNATDLVQAEVFPNPSRGLFNIENATGSPLRLEVYDQSSNLIHTDDIDERTQHKLDLGAANGIYLLRMKNENTGVIQWKRLVIIR